MVRAGEVDLVHALGASGLGYAMARRGPEGRAPFVFNPQGLEEFGGTHPGFARLKRLAYTPLQAAVRRCAQAADAILATDHALVAPVRTHLAVDPARVHVVPNAVDLETIDRARASATATAATLRARLGLAAGERLLLSVGRLEENKGFHVLAAALAELQGARRRRRGLALGAGRRRPVSPPHRRRDRRRRAVLACPPGRTRRPRASSPGGTRPPTCSSTRRCTKAARS